MSQVETYSWFRNQVDDEVNTITNRIKTGNSLLTSQSDTCLVTVNQNIGNSLLTSQNINKENNNELNNKATVNVNISSALTSDKCVNGEARNKNDEVNTITNCIKTGNSLLTSHSNNSNRVEDILVGFQKKV